MVEEQKCNNIINENDILNNNYWLFLKDKAIKFRVPFHGHFELTPLCNFDCKMCYIHLLPEQLNGKDIMRFNQWKKIIDDAYEAGMLFCSLTGGECLTHPDFNEIYCYLKKKGIIVFILTNGFLLKEKLQLFEKFPPALIQVSLYGDNENVYKKVTGVDGYKKVMDSIENAIDKKLKISIALTTNKYFKNIEKILRYFKGKNISVQSNDFLMNARSNTCRDINDIRLSIDQSIEVSRTFYRVLYGHMPEKYKGNLPAVNNHINISSHKGISCVAGRCEFLINWYGEMAMCVALSEPVGNINYENFIDVWEKVVKRADEFSMPVECFGCEYHKVCVSCPASHLINAESGHCNKDICKEGYNLVKEGIKSL